MKRIELTQDKFALVDDSDYLYLNQFNWSFATRGAAQRRFFNAQEKKHTIMYMHREIMSAPKGVHVDHINGNSLDNRRNNLRLCSNAENSRNRKKSRGKYSQYKGVTLVHGKYWASQITFNYKNYSLGYFPDEISAAIAYDQAALKYFKEYAKLNFPEKEKA